MSENIEKTGNFIHDMIDEDIASGRYADRPITTRYPPEPNGYMHIGHAKAINISYSTAQKYGGRFYLRFDDTNPVAEDTEYVESIKNDIRWLGVEWDAQYFASDYFDRMYECAVELIKRGKAFVCDLSAEEIHDTRGTLTEPGRESPYRDRSVEENLKLFEEMKAGMYGDGERVLRAKIDMSSPNMNMRDPVIYRISHNIHHNTGDSWCVYPMYDYAHPLEDAIENITHSLCTLEFEDHRPLYEWVLESLDWPSPPRQIEFARLELTHTVMSKRLLKKLVTDGTVDGWDDPRLSTLAGMRRRGYTPEAIRDFCNRIGVAKANSTLDADYLEACVRDDLKNKVPGRNVVFDPIKVVITNYPEGASEEAEMENNREVPEMGIRKVPFSREIYIDGEDFAENPPPKYFRLFPGNEVRLKGAYFITCNEVIKDDSGNVAELRCTYDPATKSGSEGSLRKVKGTIHWVDARTAVPVTVREYGYLYIEDENGENILNPDSLTVRSCYAEPLIAAAEPGERFQFFRHGYYIADTGLTEPGEGGSKVFNLIVSLKSSWKGGA